MAKKLVKISLATKFRLMFGTAVLWVIAAALALPWYFTELLGEQAMERPAAEIARLRLNEWTKEHPKGASAAARNSKVAKLYSIGEGYQELKAPTIMLLDNSTGNGQTLEPATESARRNFQKNPRQQLALIQDENDAGQTLYRCFAPMRVEDACINCHGPTTSRPELRFLPNQLVGMIEVELPGGETSGPLVWLSRISFVSGGILAGLLALMIFSVITQRLILYPMKHLQELVDKVAEGDMNIRSRIGTSDEMQRLGEGFNQMLAAIQGQHDKLTAAKHALDMKLDEMEKSNVSLFQANKIKNEFLANISHELRTPLNSIIGFADLLADSKDDKIHRYGHNISVAAKSLLAMINDILDIAKIEAGKAAVSIGKVSISDTCQTLMALMTPIADKKQIELKLEMLQEIPMINTDGGKLQQILYNLISNAIKFTPPAGKVTLLASAEISASPNGGEVTLSVADTGPGIPEAEQSLVFEKFYQGGHTLTKEASGTGLGLAISKELAGLLGGKLSFKTDPGQGTIFTLYLPVNHPESVGGTPSI